MKSYDSNGLWLIFLLFALSITFAGQSLAANYAVKEGETPYKIADIYGIIDQHPETLPERSSTVNDKLAQVPAAIAFKWAFVVVRNEPGGRDKIMNISELVSNPGSEKPIITSGDKLSFYVEPGESTYVYIFIVDSINNLELIFPTSMDETVMKSEFKTGKRNYIPGKHEWFSFDDKTGTETFYILASSSPLKKLEKLMRNYINAEGDQETTKQMILNEIKGQKNSVAFSKPVEEPISFGGQIRSIKIDIATLAVEVKTKDLYSKTIKLRHE